MYEKEIITPLYLQLISQKKVLGVYTRAMETIYLSLSAQVAVGTFFMKSPVRKRNLLLKLKENVFRNSRHFNI